MASAAPGPREPQASARRDAILRASAGVFLRYGYRKTSMDDLARAAGLSRQGLYLHFATKEAIFRDSVVLLTARSLQAVRAALVREGRTIEDRLLDAFIGLVSHGDGSPMSRELMAELMTSATELAGSLVDAFDDALLHELARALRANGIAAAWKVDGVSSKDLARHLLAASKGIKLSVAAADDYGQQMRVAVRLVCRGHVVTTAA